jgi:hypothetical protein
MLSVIVLVNYADKNMTKSQLLCGQSAMKNGVDTVWPNNPETLGKEFVKFNVDIFKPGARGASCYWLFKPWVVYNSLLQLEEGDILIYADSGVEFVNSVQHVIDRMDENVFLFTNTHPNHHWTKRYVLNQFYPGKDWTSDKDLPWPQVQASVMFFRVCNETKEFVKRWLLFCQMPGYIDDSSGPCGEYPFYQDHRHDQSIISILATTSCYRLHWWPTAYAEHIRVPGDTYPVLFNHHRKRNDEYV